ncbi:TetR/AcrR family transcriptional regulator [Actinoplanes sp. NPDC000266]
MSARDRVIGAALDLFAENGVSGTSLQMIADRLGVTKAAVYHQFPTKEEIVLTAIAPAMERLVALAESTARLRSRPARVRHAVAGVVDLVVEHRRLSAVLSFDPVVIQLVRPHPAMRAVESLVDMLAGPDPDPATRIGVTMVSGGLIIAGTDPHLAKMDDEDLRGLLTASALRLLGVRPTRATVT